MDTYLRPLISCCLYTEIIRQKKYFLPNDDIYMFTHLHIKLAMCHILPRRKVN